tara:strand:- start:3975 stop:5819 length:1845 start_codon:yes stop_codon:yes gene_type:complete
MILLKIGLITICSLSNKMNTTIKSKNMLIVTTAIEETWGEKEEILFLGEWCKLYSRKEIWESRKYKTLPDPWSDRKRRFSAYNSTKNVYESTVKLLAEELNRFHQFNHPIRYWEIVCETWLRLFIGSTYHNWECISEIIEIEKELETIQINHSTLQQIPTDTEDFQTKMVSDSWNHHIFSLIINSRLSRIKLRKINGTEPKNKTVESFNQQSIGRKVLSLVYRGSIKIISYLAHILNDGSNSVFISNPYLSKLNTIKLRVKLWSFPYKNIRPKFDQKPKYNTKFRDSLSLSEKGKSEFETFIIRTMLKQIPYSYVEGLADLKKISKLNNWPKNPKAIVTAVDFTGDDLFKFYCADSVLSGSKINIICHGGSGKYKYSDWQDMDLNVSDNYFTWGWSEYSSKCVKGFFVKDKGYKRNGNKSEKHLLHIMLSQYRYQKFIDATPSYEQYINEYLEDQIQFLNKLKPDVKKNVITKLSYDFENSLKNRIDEKCSDINYATMKDDYYKLMTSAKLVVTTYNCTTPVEALAMNLPTIIYWRSNHWELAPSATHLFDKLRACGVFHDSPESAVLMIDKIWDNVDGWWQSKEVIAACDQFRMWFCRESHDPIRELADFCEM